MLPWLASYFAALVVMAGIDIPWLNFAGERFFRPAIGDMLTDNPNFVAAGLFYALYPIGILIFAIVPALRNGSAVTALLYGALFGLFAYGTYDLTNLAILKLWSVKVAAIDIAWGTFVTGIAALASYWAGSALRH